eukprot:15435293-Alexandrium_andersonii.AAC.1
MEQAREVGLEQADRHAAPLDAFVHAMLRVARDAGQATAHEIIADLARASNVAQGKCVGTCHQ